jgi:hypothetical protein
VGEYKTLFDDYVADMRGAQAIALAWWEALRVQEAGLRASPQAVEQALEARWPLGPVSHPVVIEVFRRRALECQALNDRAEDEADAADDELDAEEDDWGDEDEEDDAPEDLASLDAPVEPQQLLIEMLTGRADDLAEFLADFVFTPLGLDKDDRWI